MKRATSFAVSIIGPVVFLSLLLAVPAMGGPAGSTLLKQDGNGKLYDHDGLHVVVLSGTFREMGRQYGALLGDEIRGAYERGVVKSFVDNPSHIFTMDELNALGEALYKTLPMRQKEMLLGISEGAHISLQEAILAASIPSVQIVARKKGGGTSTSCTSGAAWGKYTADGNVITARNFDYPTMFRNILVEYRVLVILKPSDGSHSVAGLGFAGNVSFGDAMNDQGLYSGTNNAADSGGLLMFPNRTDVITQVFNVMFDASDSTEYRNLMESIRFSYPMTVVQADSAAARYFEIATWDLRVREAGNDTVIAAANQWADPSWGVMTLAGPGGWYSSLRRERMTNMLKNVPGSIVNETSVRPGLDVSLYNDDGSMGNGFSVLKKIPGLDEVTIWQVITRPSEKKMWIRFPMLTDWVAVDLNKWFE